MLLDVLFLVSITWLLALMTHFQTHEVLRIPVGFLVLMFAPGYTLISVLFPHKFGLIEKLSLSIGLSVSLIVLVGLVIQFTPIGLNGTLIVLAVALLMTSLLSVNVIRRRPRSLADWYWESVFASLRKSIGFRNSIVAIFSLALLLAFVMFIYEQQKIPESDPFTEFVLLDMKGGTNAYDVSLKVSKKATYSLLIANHENREVEYDLKLVFQGEEFPGIKGLRLEDDERLLTPITFVPDKPAERSRLEFHLLMSGDNRPYLSTYLWIEVAPP